MNHSTRRGTRIYQKKRFNSTAFLRNGRTNMSGQLPISCVVKLDSIYTHYPLKGSHVWYQNDQEMTIFNSVYELIRFCLNNKTDSYALPSFHIELILSKSFELMISFSQSSV